MWTELADALNFIFSFWWAVREKDFPQLQLYNTLSGKTEPFAPLSGREVKMYNCGPTVYDEQHIGNLRGPLLANVLKRTLIAWGYRVKHVSNITDVGHLTGDNQGDADVGEDRMEASARKQGKSAQEIAGYITKLFFNDLNELGIDRSKMQFPKATDYIPEQIALVKTLWEKGYAYKTSDGIYFDTSKFKKYGALGHIDQVRQRDGARVEENREKKNPHDFALWKLSPLAGVEGEKRQQEWPSPWGMGFPGWHIECTAMIFKLLGKQIDIHMGGMDLIPIHHNNEIAQAEAATGKPFVAYWIHNAFITVENKRLSKSQGNTLYLHQIVDRGYSSMSLRYWYLTGHYRTPMNFTWDAIEGADKALKRLMHIYLELPAGGTPHKKFLKDFYAKIAHDLDTAGALASVWDFIKSDGASPADKKITLAVVDKIFGLGLNAPRAMSKVSVVAQSDLPKEVQILVEEREASRKNKDFLQADSLRAQIAELGYEITDAPEGPQISPKM